MDPRISGDFSVMAGGAVELTQQSFATIAVSMQSVSTAGKACISRE
jgi:hypothetical protein